MEVAYALPGTGAVYLKAVHARKKGRRR